MDLTRLLHPASIAVVGASPREETYAHQTLANLATLGYPGRVYGVNPRHEAVLGVPCVPSLADLPEPADAVVVALPAAAVPDAVEAAGAAGCGGAVVYAAGFGEARGGGALQEALRAAARRHGLPVCGPNCDGIVQLHERAALWGDALVPRAGGDVALVSQSGNLAVNALALRRGPALHTVVSSGNETVVDTAGWLEALAAEAGVRSIALFAEADGDGARLCEALARCAEAGVRVAVLKAGASAAGGAAAAAHTGSVAGDLRVFRALVREAGAAWTTDFHELLEVAKALAVRPRRATSAPPGGGLAILTCSGADAGVGADEAARRGLPLATFASATRERLRALLPPEATIGNPLDYTALIWGDVPRLRDLIGAVGADPAVGEVLVYFDRPPGLSGATGASWDAVREGIEQGAAASPVPTMVASAMPELLDEDDAATLGRSGVAALAGLAAGLAGAAARRTAPGDPARLRAIAAACRDAAARGTANGAGTWLAEHEAKDLLRADGLPVVTGQVTADADAAAAAADALGYPVALKRSAPALRHKSEAGALLLDVRDARAVRAGFERLAADGDGANVLVERMAAPGGVELLVAARADAVVPALVLGLGGIWTELLDDVAIVPLPAGRERVHAALRSLRGAHLLTGGRGRPALDLAAAADLAVAAGEMLLRHRLALLELNPVIVHEHGAVAVDAVARTATAAPLTMRP